MNPRKWMPTFYVLVLALLIGFSRWLLPLSSTEGRIVISCGLVLIAIDLTIIQFRLLRRIPGVRIASRLLLTGVLTGSTLLVSVLTIPAALAAPEWLTGCSFPLLGEHRFGNYGPDYIIEIRTPMTIAPADVESFIATYDGYDGRRNSYAPEQNAESLRIEFYLNGDFQGASAASPDLTDGIDFTDWSGSLGTIALPNGADEVVISHPGSYAGMPQANSVTSTGGCLIVNPYPPPTTIPPTTIPPTTIPPTTIPPTTAPTSTVPPTTAPTSTVPPTTTIPPAIPTTSPPKIVDTTVPPTTAPTSIPPTTAPTSTVPPEVPSTAAPTTTTTTTTTTPETIPPLVKEPTTIPPTTTTSPAPTTMNPPVSTTAVPPSVQTVPPAAPPTTPSTTPPVKTFGPPPGDRIGTPPSSLPYTGSTVVHIATSAWLFLLAGVSLQIIFLPEQSVHYGNRKP